MSFPTAYFCLIGDFDPDEISSQLEIEPSISNRKGSINPASGQPREAATWLLFGSTEDGGDVAGQIITLLTCLKPKSETVAELSERFNGSINVYASLDSSFPGFFLGAGILKDLARLNVDVDCSYVRDEELAATEVPRAD